MDRGDGYWIILSAKPAFVYDLFFIKRKLSLENPRQSKGTTGGQGRDIMRERWIVA